MDTMDKIRLHELVIKGKKLEAVKLVMEQTNMGLREAKEYVDEYCRQEKIGESYSGPSYSATNENGLTIYYKTENGEKHIISKEEAPEFIVNKMESVSYEEQKASSPQNDFSNHKKGRRILAYISIPVFAIGIFFLYQIFINKASAFDNIGGAIACGMGIVALCFIELMLWLDESIAKRRKKRVKEMEIPAAFIIEGKRAKRIAFIIALCAVAVCAIVLVGAVISLLEKNYYIALFGLAIFLFFVYITWSNGISYAKNAKLSLHISGETISLCQGNNEMAILSAETIVCIFSCHGVMGPYPRAFLRNTERNLHAAIFLDLPEYHLLKKYLIQQEASVTDQYNHW